MNAFGNCLHMTIDKSTKGIKCADRIGRPFCFIVRHGGHPRIRFLSRRIKEEGREGRGGGEGERHLCQRSIN